MACLKTFAKFGFRTSTDKWPGLHSITHREKHPSRSLSLSLYISTVSVFSRTQHTHTHTHKHTQLAAAEEASLRHLKLLISFLSRYMQPTVKCYKSNMSVSAEHTHTHTHTQPESLFSPHCHFLINTLWLKVFIRPVTLPLVRVCVSVCLPARVVRFLRVLHVCWCVCVCLWLRFGGRA